MEGQQRALDMIHQALEATLVKRFITGGYGKWKTEVYLQAIQSTLNRGEGAIVLVPEIALTPQTVERFRHDLEREWRCCIPDQSDGERHDEWHRIREGEARIAVGARSALFAPIESLGLIVVDEEHEPTYKQEESPRYHARDAAVMRGRLEGVVWCLDRRRLLWNQVGMCRVGGIGWLEWRIGLIIERCR